MNPKVIISCLFLFFATVFTAFHIDDDPLTALLKKLEDLNQKNPQEKVHLHLDKPYYAIGDDIFFKAYVIETRNSQPSTVSNVLYVELINEKDSIKKQLKLPLMGGITWGDFKLTDSLSEGNYRIRAYTQIMRNAKPDFFFDKTIKIGNSWANNVFTSASYTFRKENSAEEVNTALKFTDKKGLPYAGCVVNYEVQFNLKNISKGKVVTNEKGVVNFDFNNLLSSTYKSGKIMATITLPNKQKIVKSIPIKATSNSIDVQFFPESGNLVESIPSKIAVKAINASGLGENVNGSVLDNYGLEITKFNTTYLGMGNFVISPEPGKSYTARLKFADGSEQTVKLPKVEPNGYVLAINNTDSSKMSVKIMLSASLLNTGELKLVAQSNGNVSFVQKVSTEKQVSTVSVPKKDLPSGIYQLTLFSAKDQPVCERLVFVKNPASNLDIQVQSNKQNYDKRENVMMTLTAAADGKPTVGSFSVSVTNTESVKPDLENESNIFTTLLLTSDLSGYVEKPNHYFLKDDLTTRQELDNLMLTQGWRRFLWKDLMAGIVPTVNFKPEKSLKVSGVVTSGKKPVVKGKVSLFSSSGGLFSIDTLTDANGRFNFDNLVFNDSTKFVVQARTAKNKKFVEIRLDATPGQIVTKNKNTGDVEVNVNEAISSYIKKSESYFDELSRRGLLERSIQLQEVTIVEKKNPAPNSTNINGAGQADYVLTADQLGLNNCIVLSQCLQGRVAGLIIQNGIAYLTRNQRIPMQIVIDGVNVEGDFLNNIPVQDVESIEVLKSTSYTAIYGSRGSGGVLIITTKRGGGGNYSNSYAPGIITYAPKGYYSSREFYSPKYTAENTDKRADLRTTVYWNPQLITDANGKSQFNYFNTDEPGTYRMVIEGINELGQLARTVYTYQVN